MSSYQLCPEFSERPFSGSLASGCQIGLATPPSHLSFLCLHFRSWQWFLIVLLSAGQPLSQGCHFLPGNPHCSPGSPDSLSWLWQDVFLHLLLQAQGWHHLSLLLTSGLSHQTAWLLSFSNINSLCYFSLFERLKVVPISLPDLDWVNLFRSYYELHIPNEATKAQRWSCPR